MEIRADLISQIHGSAPDYCFLPEHYILDVTTVRDGCKCCDNRRLRNQRIVRRYPVGILLGRPMLRHHIKKCPVCGKEYPCEQLNSLVPPHCNYTYDIIIEVGLKRFRQQRQNQEIQKEIQNRYHLFLPQSSINEIADLFLDYFAAVHYAKANDIRQIIIDQGGYVGHFDGTCEAGTDILFTAIDEISEIVLLTGRMPTENVNDIKGFLAKCKQLYGVPLATMRDLSKNIFLARDEIFGKVPDFICQYHFLENVGKALFKKTHQELTMLLRNLKIKPRLRSLRNNLVRGSKKGVPIQQKQFCEYLNDPDRRLQLDKVKLRKHLTFFILRWLDDYSSELKGEYFPFDQSSLVFYRRCVKIYDLLNELLTGSDPLKGRQRQTLASIVSILAPVKNDGTLTHIAQRFEKEVNIFEELRDVLRFKRSDNSPILRQHPPASTIKDAGQIKERLNKFYQQLQKRAASDDSDIVNSSKILITYLDRYSDKLVGHLVTLPGKNQVILLDRTNNISEQRFGNTKTGWRRRLGTKKLTRHVQAARHEEFLVANLNKQDYINVVYGGSLDNMSSYFAQYCKEAFKIRKLRSLPEEKKTMPISKKSLRQPGMLLSVVQAISGLLSCPA